MFRLKEGGQFCENLSGKSEVVYLMPDGCEKQTISYREFPCLRLGLVSHNVLCNWNSWKRHVSVKHKKTLEKHPALFLEGPSS